MRSWFYVKDGQQHGPVAQDILSEMFETGALADDTLLWAEGLPKWCSARDLKALKSEGHCPPPIPSPQPVHNGSTVPPRTVKKYRPASPQVHPTVNEYEPSGPQTRPWIRFWARMTDFLLFTILVGTILGIGYKPTTEMGEAIWVLGPILFFAYIFVEAYMLSSWGTTPGKALLKIRLRRYDGTTPSYSEALNRAFQVWLKGEAIGIPVLALWRLTASYQDLRQEGKTSWDSDRQFFYSHQIIDPVRIVVTVLFFLGFIVFMDWRGIEWIRDWGNF